MKKKILLTAFFVLFLLTAILFIVAAIHSYQYDMDPANGVDILEGVGAGMLLVLGAIVGMCEIDFFLTAYYFIVLPKTLPKSIFMILSQLSILIVIFSQDLARLLSRYVLNVFSEEAIVIVPIFFLYVIFRMICVSICFVKKA